MSDDPTQPHSSFKRGLLGYAGDYYRLLFDHAGMSMVGTDAQCTIRSWNMAAARMFGAAAKRMVGTPLTAVIPQEGRADAERALRAAVDQGITSEFEFVHRDQSGEPRQIAVTVSPIPDRAGARIGALASFRDITNRVRLVEQLGQHRKMASLGEMAGAMAHHFNNILGGIVTSVDFALATGDPDIRHRVLQKSAQALGRATRLVDSLLAFAEGDHRHADAGDLTETVIRLVDEIEPDLSDRGMELALEIDPIPTTPIYQKQIKTILINLIENAVEAMVRGDTLTVRLGTVGDRVRLEVADSGCGMTEEEASRIFEPFYSKAHAEQASIGRREGLGLAVVHGIVQDMNGTISVSTSKGKGTTITILLPRDSSISSS